MFDSNSKASIMSNVINWFEIPAKDFDRACKFYEKVLNGTVQLMETPDDSKMGFLPGAVQGEVSGAVVWADGYNPSQDGSVVYLNGGEDLSVPLKRVEEAGGKVLIPKTSIGENGYFAQFLDCEGNRVAFHSMG